MNFCLKGQGRHSSKVSPHGDFSSRKTNRVLMWLISSCGQMKKGPTDVKSPCGEIAKMMSKFITKLQQLKTKPKNYNLIIIVWLLIIQVSNTEWMFLISLKASYKLNL